MLAYLYKLPLSCLEIRQYCLVQQAVPVLPFAHRMAALEDHDALLPGEVLALVSTRQKHSHIY